MSPHLYDEQGNRMQPGDPGTPHDYFGRPLTQDDVERRSRPVSRGYVEDTHERDTRRRQRDNRRMKILFVVLGLISSVTALYSYDAGRRSAVGLEQNAYDASYASCVSGSDLRIVMADGLDSLRRLAISGNRAPRAVVEQFFEQTQPPIDDLLTQAAYEKDSGRRYHVDAPLGEVTDAVQVEVAVLAQERCEARTQAQFPGVKPADER